MGKSEEEKDFLKRMKEEAARDVGVVLDKDHHNTARENGSVGGQMVKKMVEFYKKNAAE